MTPRLALVAALAVPLAGCVLLPTTKMDEGALEGRGEGQPPPPAPAAFKVQLIDAKLVSEQIAATGREVPAPADPLAPRPGAPGYDYRIAPYDVLTIIVYEHPELTIPAGEIRSVDQTGYTVSPDGYIFFPHVGRFQVAGHTLDEARRDLTDRLAVYVRRPQVQILVATYRGKRFQVTGEVLQSGTYPIADVPLRVSDAIAAAKGTGPEADLREVTLSRAGKTYVLDLQRFYEEGDQTQNWLLAPDDTVHVPDRSANKVFVLGEVRQPQTRQMQKARMSLAEALSDVGWLDPLAADPAQIFVLRGSYEAPQIYRLDASQADAMLLAVNFPLRPRDVVFVQTSGVARWNRSLQGLMPTVQSIWQAYDIVYRTVYRPIY
ncbi:polysaccharide biosynthesis/export family protein [Anaeromyxobacter paludicola]|uniref:Exopolysaccharide biosynthesis protein BceE n=1 Tax=Anaeromyxobacter paludicola TaxID=2918171 RepID=A0ABM7XCP8_9BACT|nr:polysaccharide biosynthesis/export family protein [Anaeromyxobacter paludicola]BDG09648.1 exopolysaccharide biosynthesis protein BceE [Anaeromyxobacter paludicola]